LAFSSSFRKNMVRRIEDAIRPKPRKRCKAYNASEEETMRLAAAENIKACP
jgi:hypothetical protein